MLIERRPRTWRAAAAPAAALWAAFAIVLALVAPVLAVQGPTKLDNPNVSPRSGSPTTTIAFSVRYRNREGSPPDHVNVVIDGVKHRMTGTGTDWRSGVTLRWSTPLPAGTHTIAFEAADTRRFSDQIASGTVTITAPPRPTPTPAPTPRPTPTPDSTAPAGAPTPSPSDGSDGTATGGSGTGGDGATGSGTSDLGGAIGGSSPDERDDSAPNGGSTPPGAGPSGAGGGGGDSTTGGSSGGSFGGGVDAAGSLGGDRDGTTGTAGDSLGGDSSGGGTAAAAPGWGALAVALDALGVRPSSTTTMLPMLVGTTTATAMALAFAIFGKKRRDGEPPAPDEVLQAQAARGHSGVPGGEVVGVRGPVVAPPIDTEAGLPRWRRPSLLAARKADPARAAASTSRMSFANGAVDAVDGHERRVIRYRVVRLLDAPDELRSTDIGSLDQGDEVQLLERSGAYWLVLCPDGRQGWLHKMTLGEIVTDAPPQSPLSPEIDDDVLSAYLSARARA